MMSLRALALQALQITDPQRKTREVLALQRDAALWPVGAEAQLAEPAGLPGRPTQPALVPVSQLVRRTAHTAQGRCALLHAVTHIEFNAVNLALDAVWRYAGLPDTYYREWLQVAAEEAHHFSLLAAHLQALGCMYGDYPAHDGLWSMVEATRGDVLARMALVPRTLEARGLDATPPMQDKLRRAGDLRAVEILDIILRDEVGHVAVGNRWYRWLCSAQGLDPLEHYEVLARRYSAPRPRPPFNHGARQAAGFTAEELDALDRAAATAWHGETAS